jgi:hypothetical protein
MSFIESIAWITSYSISLSPPFATFYPFSLR